MQDTMTFKEFSDLIYDVLGKKRESVSERKEPVPNPYTHILINQLETRCITERGISYTVDDIMRDRAIARELRKQRGLTSHETR